MSYEPPLLIDANGLARLLSVSRSQIWKLLASGRLPAPVRISSRCPRWRRDHVDQWIGEGCPSDWQPSNNSH